MSTSSGDAEIEATTRAEIASLPEFQPFDEWKAAFAERLAGRN